MKVRRTIRTGLLAGLLGSAMLVVAAPAANASLNRDRASFDFGSRSVGTTSDPQTFALIANCDAPSGIPGICGSPASFDTIAGLPTTTGTGFAIVPATDGCTARGGVLITPTFPGADVCTLQVIFKPTSGGTKTGKLQAPAGPSIALKWNRCRHGQRNHDGQEVQEEEALGLRGQEVQEEEVAPASFDLRSL